MNPNLQQLADKILEHLRDAEDLDHIKSLVKKLDKEITILEFKLDRTEKVKRTTSVLLEETIEELEQKRKAVEAQNRALEIEAALERVRARAMAMRNSGELNGLIGAVFTELTQLDLVLTRSIIMIYEPDSEAVRWWMANSETPLEPMNYLIKYHKHPAYLAYIHAWKGRHLKWEYLLEGPMKEQWDEFLFSQTELANLPDFVKEGMQEPDRVFLSASFNSFGGLSVASLEPLSEQDFDILIRFAKVFDLTYTRFNDLKQAETRELEARKQASLDRVRAEIASMRTTKDLERITPLIWRELTTLEVPFFRCGAFIIDRDNRQTQIYLSTPSGASLAALHLGFENPLVAKVVMHWEKQEVYTEKWDKQQFIQWTKSLIDQGLIQSSERYQGGAEAPDHLVLHFCPFSQGMLYVGGAEKLTNAQVQLLDELAKAFAVAYARYEDFVQLEAAKTQIEKTLEDLKNTQSQLIQSEKMASLGELTAGIAHEIQNPLNFVNNFSELNEELITELKVELKKGNLEEAVNIAEDLLQNEEKIKQHGKRADAIVKSMLQHSRVSSGQKEMTDLNALCDEYLRLAYHGMRSKDKSFNAKYETDFDKNLREVKVVPQDIGRVLLNLINNAFHAVGERNNLTDLARRSSGEDRSDLNRYQPMVSISTKLIPTGGAGSVLPGSAFLEIKVSDNGHGIPDVIKDKIFQPFFTTKPTGSGTGLGLSLSYDIVKAHGGELKVETNEGVGSDFIIKLPINMLH